MSGHTGDGDRGGNPEEDKERRHQEAPADPEDAGDESHKGAGGDRTLAFALNGRIAGIGTADKFRRNDDAYYYALLAPTLFAPTGNRVEAFVVTGPADAPVLTPVRIGN